MSFFQTKIGACYLSVVITAFIVAGCNLTPVWGYSTEIPLRLETQQLLRGDIRLFPDARGMFWDSAFGKNGIEQIWGMGVPLWRLPFEALARVIGAAGFPDRFEFCVALALATYALIRLQVMFCARCGQSWSLAALLTALLPTVLMPAFLSLSSSRFLVYEEVEAYGYLFGLMLMAGTVRFGFRPNARDFLTLCFLSGCSGFIRPTFEVYGAATFVMANIIHWRSFQHFKTHALALFLFIFGGAVLLLSNFTRFGSPLEFGHSLAVNGLPSMVYVTHFGGPFSSVKLIPALKELTGALFLAKSAAFGTVYGSGLFKWENPAFRWRELYFSTYDTSALLVIAVVWSRCSLRLFHHLPLGEATPSAKAVETAGYWSLISAMPLFLFYSRFPFLSSRYLLDFGPAFAAAFLALLWGAMGWTGNRKKPANWNFCLAICLIGWWTHGSCTMSASEEKYNWRFNRLHELFSGQNTAPQPERTVTGDETARKIENYETNHTRIALPEIYTNGSDFGKTGILFNGSGWDSTTAATEASVILFIQDPEMLELDVEVTDDGLEDTNGFDVIRAKIGLQYLERENIQRTAKGARLFFRGPKSSRYRAGVQMLSIAMMSPQELNDGYSRFRLTKVIWHGGQVVKNIQ